MERAQLLANGNLITFRNILTFWHTKNNKNKNKEAHARKAYKKINRFLTKEPFFKDIATH